MKVFRGELMYETRCDKGCVINNENTPFWKLPLSLTDTHTPVVDVVGDRKSIDCIVMSLLLHLVKKGKLRAAFS